MLEDIIDDDLLSDDDYLSPKAIGILKKAKGLAIAVGVFTIFTLIRNMSNNISNIEILFKDFFLYFSDFSYLALIPISMLLSTIFLFTFAIKSNKVIRSRTKDNNFTGMLIHFRNFIIINVVLGAIYFINFILYTISGIYKM